MKQQHICLVSLLAESKLKVKEGTHKTLVRMRLSEICTMPIWVTEAKEPLGNCTHVETTTVILVKKEGEQIM